MNDQYNSEVNTSQQQCFPPQQRDYPFPPYAPAYNTTQPMTYHPSRQYEGQAPPPAYPLNSQRQPANASYYNSFEAQAPTTQSHFDNDTKNDNLTSLGSDAPGVETKKEADEERGLGATVVGGAGGGLLGHHVGKKSGHGLIGTIGGALAGAVGANALTGKSTDQKPAQRDRRGGRRECMRDRREDRRDRREDKRDDKQVRRDRRHGRS
ncbi:hypothetical protein MMC09_006361 [Bachmanniomyces sp. S44760]|nr:hypothetical protein [Bachmanniomyces sp. S44760]